MLVRTPLLVVAAVSSFALLPADLLGQAETATVENALSAAPAAIASAATVVDLEGNVLRKGSGEYTCIPDDPTVPGNSPMCLDAGWLAWSEAMMNKTEPPALDAISFGYMLQGGFPVSNVDPFATGPTDDNEWIEASGPHIVVLVPDTSMLHGITTDFENGGPYVMWKDTPYAHLMIPTTKKD